MMETRTMISRRLTANMCPVQCSSETAGRCRVARNSWHIHGCLPYSRILNDCFAGFILKHYIELIFEQRCQCFTPLHRLTNLSLKDTDF